MVFLNQREPTSFLEEGRRNALQYVLELRRRFLETWRGYLGRTGDDAQLGPWRMAMPRRVAAAYGIGQADEAELEARVDLLV